MTKLKNWFVTSNQDGWTPPECVSYFLSGNVYDHPNFQDGDPITSSSIKNVIDCNTYKIVETKNTKYYVYPEDANPKYEQNFPDAFKRLSVTNCEFL